VPPSTLALHRSCLDQLTAGAVASYRARGGEIHCRRGCSGCCTLAVNATWPEAHHLADGLDEGQADRLTAYVDRLVGALPGIRDPKGYLALHRRELGACPFLARDGACGVYERRPLSCRALLSTRESSWCAMDFSTLSSGEKQAYMASLDRTAVAFPLHYLALTRDAGENLEQQLLRAMHETCGFSLYGSMPVLVHLARRYRLAGAVAAGSAAVRALLRQAGLDHPLLLSLRDERSP
jgi:Fe-S-cluster containining protein